jgi:hypothetical protein
MMPRVQRALFEGVAALDQLGIRYAVIGGLAVGVWALPRATRDVDLYAVGPLGEAILDRRRRMTTEGRDIWFASAEDLTLLKVFSDRPRDLDVVVAFRAGPGTRDLGVVGRGVEVLAGSSGG